MNIASFLLNVVVGTLNSFQGPCLRRKTGVRWMLKQVQYDGNRGARDMPFHPYQEGLSS